MDSFPAYFPLTGRRVVIVGSGEAAAGKAKLFDGSPATLARIPADDPAAFEPDTYIGAVLAFIALDDLVLDERAAAAARAAHVPLNVVDRPALCDFFTPAVVDRGEVVAAVGTGGRAPLLAATLRGEMEAAIPKGAGRLAALLGRLQGEVRAAFPDMEARRAFLRAALDGPAARAALAGDMDHAEHLLRGAIDAAREI